ncbi:MAG: hypothetical protein Q9183_006542, partial [Haloplaca sp. 2 TL-2023]
MGHHAGVIPLPINWEPGYTDNIDGITLVDVSDSADIKYCFTSIPSIRDLWEPISAYGYIAHYAENLDKEANVEEDHDAEVNEEEEEKVAQGASGGMFDSSSPECPLENLNMIRKKSLRNWLEGLDLLNTSIEESFEQCAQDGPRSHRSLRKQTLEQLCSIILRESDYDPAVLAEVRQLPDFAQNLRNKICSLAEANELGSLPEIAFEGEPVVDLSRLTNVKSELLLETATSLLKGGKVRSLDLSHLRQLSEKDLTSIINIESGLETLYILNMPHISLQSVSSFWSQCPSLNNIYHTELFKRPFYKICYSDLLSELKSPPIDSRNPIRHILFARLLSQSNRGYANLRKQDGVTVDWQRAKLATDLHDPSDHICLSSFPMTDTFLPLAKLVNGLVNFLTCAMNNPESCLRLRDYFAGSNMVESFASASSSVG